MKWLNANMRSFDAPLQETPKVFDAVRVNITARVLFRMVNHLMDVLSIKAIVRPPGIVEQFAPFSTWHLISL
jgi:hypothetical protein